MAENENFIARFLNNFSAENSSEEPIQSEASSFTVINAAETILKTTEEEIKAREEQFQIEQQQLVAIFNDVQETIEHSESTSFVNEEFSDKVISILSKDLTILDVLKILNPNAPEDYFVRIMNNDNNLEEDLKRRFDNFVRTLSTANEKISEGNKEIGRIDTVLNDILPVSSLISKENDDDDFV